jgi:hypothetical protein
MYLAAGAWPVLRRRAISMSGSPASAQIASSICGLLLRVSASRLGLLRSLYELE